MIYRRPLEELRTWPASDVRLLRKYLARCPAPDERIERLLAQLVARYHNAHKGEAEPITQTRDLLYLDAWKPDSMPAIDPATGYTDVDLSFIRALGS